MKDTGDKQPRVKRYTVCPDFLRPMSDQLEAGRYVLESDYNALSAKCAALEGERDAARRLIPKRDGNFLDEMWCCKVCDGEIPDGHMDNCDIWKLEKKHRDFIANEYNNTLTELTAANERIKALEEERDNARHCLTLMIEKHKHWVLDLDATAGQAAEMERARAAAFANEAALSDAGSPQFIKDSAATDQS